ncbi:F-box protein SKIP14-like [Neltuma alba]|uniref:F-box protein SKIP14-like n=1 Tax=Neltuma alba TaxID=207710 RepID=UPI0010A40639|nr:F-box protein SKIP14-like [Prosopis alba]XP_028771312.1 F-box protein SKIP14-like [Prosopis alba]XP_028780436.1 F-box protein SKIP14-like [Prosopis alba]
MALNFSHRPIFAAHDVDNCFDYGRDRCDRPGSQESVSKDILDLLPSDPFGMDISTTFTAITGWLEDLEADYVGYRGKDVGPSDDNYQLVAGLNLIWNNAMRFHAFPGSLCVENKPPIASGLGDSFQKDVGVASCNDDFGSSCNTGDMASFGYKHSGIDCWSTNTYMDGGNHPEGGELAHHSALGYALSYLGVRDLLAVESVCKSLNSVVRGDPLLWKSIHIDQPISEKITDDLLLQLTKRAQGNLQCLSLVECTRITDDALKQVLDSNPNLTKLSVPGCTRLSVQGIVSILKDFKSTGAHGVKLLRIGGLYGVTEKHFEELMLLLGTDSQMLQQSRKPHFYHRGSLYLSDDDDCAIDIEMCPRCQNFRLVYDCPAEGCQGMGHAAQVCRACTLCIARCSQCGQCINDNEYEETFCLEILCASCADSQAPAEGTR